MRIFKKGNWEGTKAVCPICKTQKKGEVILVAIEGSGDDMTKEFCNYEAVQVHLECLDLWITKDKKIIYQRLKE